MNELSSLIKKYQTLRNMKTSQLAVALGYTNISKALRRLNAFIHAPNVEFDLAIKLRMALAIPLDEYESTINQVNLCVYQRRLKSFKPSLSIILSGRPNPLFAAGFFTELTLPKQVRGMVFEEEMKTVFNVYKQDQINKFKSSNFYINSNSDYLVFVKTLDKESLSNIPIPWVFGNGYRYFRAFNETLHFNRLGQLIKRSTTLNQSITKLTVSGKDILPLLNNSK